MTESWVKIPGHERYIVSSEGRVRLHRVGSPILAGSFDKDGYRRVRIDGKNYRVHRLVCEAFHGPAPKGAYAAHNDGSKTNNAAANLRWATPAENAADAIAHGTFVRPKTPTGERHPMAKLSDEQCEQLRELATKGVGQREMARRFSISQSHVSRLLSGQKRAKGIAQNGAKP